MPGGKRRKGSGIGAWREFAGRHRGNPHLAADPLYAMPEGLIDLLIAELPTLFNEAEVAFERDLAKAARGGLFFRRRVVPCLLLEESGDDQAAVLDHQIRDAQIESRKAFGVSTGRFDAFDERQARLDERADLRAAAYAGWLVTNRQFLAERDVLREREGSYVEEHGGFPSLPRSYLGERRGTADRREAHFHLFYRRWDLDSFLTWDLPLPLRPEVGVATLDTFTLSGAGITLFVPWYIAQDGRFSPDELAAHLKALHRPDHLKGWLSTPAGGGKTLGDVRHRHSLVLHRYWGLALVPRYGARLAGRTMQLDRAFARFLGLKSGEDTVKKIRTAVRRAAEAEPG